MQEDFLNNIQTNTAQVTGNLKDEFIVSVYESNRQCGVSFKIITRLERDRLHSYITDVEHKLNDFICDWNLSVIEHYKDNLKSYLLSALKEEITSITEIELPANYEEYSALIGNYILSGDPDPTGQI